MNKSALASNIVNFVNEYLMEQGIENTIEGSSTLIGSDSLIDSMGLVELCVFLEDICLDQDFDFDWTSESAMSKSRSMFRSAESLAEEVLEQYRNNKK